MVKLKKLFWYRNRIGHYLISMSKEDFFKEINSFQKKNISNLKVTNNQVTFISNHNNYNNTIEVRNLWYIFFKKYIISNISIILVFMTTIFIFSMSNVYIREIKFTDNNLFNPEVMTYIEKQTSGKKPFQKFNRDLNVISQELRSKFIEYAWIGLRKNGGLVLIDVESHDIPNIEEENLNETGNLIAKCDGYIKELIIMRGVLLVTKNQSVKKGDLLVSGNLKHFVDETNQNFLVRSKGVVLAKCINYQTIRVAKNIMVINYTGNYYEKKLYKIGKKTLGKNINKFKNSDTIISNILTIGKIVSIDKLKVYEKEQVVVKYDFSEAKQYAQSKIRKNFNNNIVNKKEQINKIEYLIHHETDNYYEFTFLVSSYQNIAEFTRNT